MNSACCMVPTTTQWLEQLELTQYVDAFAEQAVTSAHLPQLTDSDLITIGLSVLGHRLRMLDSIAELSSLPVSASSNIQSSKPKTERRQLTVLFCDLVDSTGLARKLAPEDLRDVLRSYQRIVEKIVQRYDGFIAQYLGDGLMVYFGYPEAHEDDAIRAAFTALELPAAIVQLNTDLQRRFNIQLSVRTGVSTGGVVVGHIGSDSGTDALATGVTPNEAAHLQQLTVSNSNLISSKTRELIGDRFLIKTVTGSELPQSGIDGAKNESSTRMFEIVGVTNAESRFAATKKFYYTEMVGRNDEFQELQSLWSASVDGNSQTVLLSGEAGIGKSRMVQSLFDVLNDLHYHRVVNQCSPYHADSPFYPAIQQLAYAAQISAIENAEQKLLRIHAMLEHNSGSNNTCRESYVH